MATSPLPALHFAALSDVGRRRRHNEDAYLVDTELGLALLADGMGGHGNGAVASRTVVETVRERLREALAQLAAEAAEDPDLERTPLPRETLVQSAVRAANARVFELNVSHGAAAGHGMGATLVGLWLDPALHAAQIFHAGDSRLFRLRDGVLRQLTRDHTLYQRWEDGGQVGPPPKRGALLQALGPAEQVSPEVRVEPVSAGDTFLLCSDGLTTMLSNFEIEELLRDGGTAELEGLCRRLVAAANERGGADNVTVVMARYV